jgi:hypothetical protein
VLSDVFTFLIQGSGGGLVATQGGKDIGQKACPPNNHEVDMNRLTTNTQLFLIGLILQLVSFVVFVLMYLRWLFLVRSREPEVWECSRRQSQQRDWRTLAIALGVSCLFVIVRPIFTPRLSSFLLTHRSALHQIRCVFRTIELAQGWSGKLATTEAYLYGLDVLVSDSR